MEFRVEKRGEVSLVILLAPSLDADNAREFKESISPLLEGNPRIIFDLNQIEFVDSNGLGAVLSCLRRIKQMGGDLKLVNLSPQVKSLCELLRMNRILDLFDTTEEALAAF